MPQPRRGEVRPVDVGLAGNVRPGQIVTEFPADNELALVTIIAHTTSLRGTIGESSHMKSFLREGAFHLQQIQTVPLTELVRKLGEMSGGKCAAVCARLRQRVGL